ncbi:MAG TPA: YncE family protein, partial [Candidatus Acidoferrales bacterium]|nr:YncE family protein [Candidatus Acidoferrales bacterium]
MGRAAPRKQLSLAVIALVLAALVAVVVRPPGLVKHALAAGPTVATVTVGSNPRGVYVDTPNHVAYVANFGSNTVSKLLLPGNGGTCSGAAPPCVVATATQGLAGPFALALDSANNQLYVANQSTSHVDVLDATTMNQTTLITGPITCTAGVCFPGPLPGSGCGPVAVAVNPNTGTKGTVYVGNNGCSGDTVSVIDAASNTVINTISLTVTPICTVPCGTISYHFITDLAINTPTDRLYVVTNSAPESLIVVTSPESASPTFTATPLAAGSNATGVAVNDATRQIWISTANGVIVANDEALPATTPLSASFAVTAHQKIAVNRQANRAYVPAEGSSLISVLDGALRSTAQVGTGSSPNGVGVDLGLGTVVVSNFSSGSVSVISNEDPFGFAPRVVVNDAGDACCADSGQVSLRKALSFAGGSAFPGILDGRQVSGSSVGGGLPVGVYFDRRVFPGTAPATIRPASQLPDLTKGTSVVAGAGAPAGTIAASSGAVLDGSAITAAASGLQVSSGSGSVIEGVRVQRFTSVGIYLVGAAAGATVNRVTSVLNLDGFGINSSGAGNTISNSFLGT